MDADTMLGALVDVACVRSNLPMTNDVATHHDSIVSEDNLESERSNHQTTKDVATHDDSIVTEDNLESAHQQCSHSTSSSTRTANATETISCNRKINNVESGRSERCGKTPVVVRTKTMQYCEEHNNAR
eukprot:scaffold66797_cov61-Attheya_sp.AAC.1